MNPLFPPPTNGTPTPTTDYVYDIKVKFEPFFMDWTKHQEVVKLPSLFNQEHINDIAEKIFLCDPAGNMFQLAVEKRYSEAYFIQGWSQLGDFYGLDKGGWVRLVFIADDMFLIELRNRVDHPVNYPLPAKFFLIGHDPITFGYPMVQPVPSHFATICKKPDYFYVLEKTLTHSDVTSGLLHIPHFFCTAAFRKSNVEIFIFDEYGRNSTCIVAFDKATMNYCGIIQGWTQFCQDKAYFEGLRLELAVPRSSPTMMSVIVKHNFI